MKQVLVLLASQLVVGGAISGLLIFGAREWMSERIKQSISAEYARKLEDHKREGELRFNDQVRLRKVYEELSMSLEEIFGAMPEQDPKKMTISVHKMFALLALYAPDDVYQPVKNTFYTKGSKAVDNFELSPLPIQRQRLESQPPRVRE